MTVNGFRVGDPLTDNAWSETGYRWHDTLHLAHAACLGWSPVFRGQHRRQPRVHDPQVHPPGLGQHRAQRPVHRGDHQVGEGAPRPGSHHPAHGPGRPHPARHDPRRRRGYQAAADPIQPRAQAPQPWPKDLPQAATRSAAHLGHAAPGPPDRRTSSAPHRPRRGLHHDPHDRRHRPSVGRGDRPRARLHPPARDPRRMAATRVEGQVLPASAQGRLLPQPGLGPGLPVDLPPFLAGYSKPRSRTIPASHAVAPASTKAAAGTCSWDPTAATTAAATTPAGCSGPRATGGTCRSRASPAAWSSPTRPPARHADRRLPPPPGQPTKTPDTSGPAATASQSSRRRLRPPAGCRSSSASRRTDSDTATGHGWPKKARPRSSPSSDSATRCPACAVCTPTSPTGCAPS
jgi:hypothetical protein